MSEPQSSTIHWNRGENTTSDIGPNGAENGAVLRQSAKFLNGSLVTADNNGYIEFGDIGLSDSNKGILSFWVKPKSASGAIARIAEWCLYLNDSSETFSNRLGVYFDYTNSRIYVELRYGGSTGRTLMFNTSWTANQKIHIAVGWNDVEFFNSIYHLALYVDGVFAVGNTGAIAFSSPLTKYLINALYFGGVVFNGQRCINTVVDNSKINDGGNQSIMDLILSGKDVEGFITTINTQVMII